MNYSEETIKTEEIFDGKIIRVKRDTVKLCNGNTSTREIVEHPGGVAIVPFTKDGKIVLVKQFRKPLEKEIWEIPAGKLNYGEEHYSCGKRELEEETGFKADVYEYLGQFYTTPGFCNEIIHIYYADELQQGQLNPDEDEFLSVGHFTPQEIEKMILNGEILDGKTVIGFFLARKHKMER